jgi:glycosyltransferase involved in cell wall biosynthesis
VRILINAVGASMGGAVRHLGPFLEHLRGARSSWKIEVFITLGAIDRRTMPAGVRIHEVKRSGALQRIRWDTWEVAEAARHQKADLIVNLANYGPIRPSVPSLLYQRNSLYFDAAWLARRPLNDRIQAMLRRTIAYRQMAASATIVVPSHAMATFIRSWSGWDPSVPIRVIPHSVDSGRFGFHPRTLDPSAPIRILNVSHAAPHKDFGTAIAILSVVRKSGIDATLLLTASSADNASYFRQLVATIHGLGLDGNVQLLGRVTEVEKLYAACDIFLSTSQSESFGFPLLEAMASGIPVVASSIPSSVEILTRTANLFQPGDARQGAECIQRELNLSAEARRVRLAAARSIALEHSWSSNAENIAVIANEALETWRPPKLTQRA